MVVHVEDASVARGAVMAPVRFEHVADEAVAAALRFVVAEVEAPEGRHLAWITVHSLKERPQQHQKEYVIHHHE
jgi:hypothetical protein